jgi:hypothetical protein
MPVLRRLLLLKDYSALTPEEMTLYRSYKNRVISLVEYAKNPTQAEWSLPFEIFHNLTQENIPGKEIYAFYRALFDVTSYYQHNTAGIAKFGNALITKLGPPENLVPELHLRDLPSKLLGDENYDWIGTDDDDVTTDVVNRVGDSAIFLEFKFRVDSGCTAGRREVWEAKFLKIIQHIVTGKKLFSKDSRQESLSELLNSAGINVIELYIGILFDIKGNFATVGEDKKFICYGGMHESYQRTLAYLNQNNVPFTELTPTNPNTESLLFEFKRGSMTVRGGAKYANSAIDSLFKGKGKDLSTIKAMIDSLIYDDLWLSQLIAISERAILLIYNTNYLLMINNILESEYDLRKEIQMFSQIRYTQTDNAMKILTSLTQKILAKHKSEFNELPIPMMVTIIRTYLENYSFEEYIADIIQVLVAASK